MEDCVSIVAERIGVEGESGARLSRTGLERSGVSDRID